MTEEDLKAAIASDPERADLPEDLVEHAAAYDPRGPKKQVALRLDPDVLAWFRAEGPGYQTRINAALRAFVEVHRQRP